MARPASDIPERILAAARRHFLVQGVDGASLRKIAAEAETSIGMIHYHYKTKEALFLAVVDDVYETLLADLAAALDPKHDVETRLHGFFDRFERLSETELDVVRMIIREALLSSERLGGVIARFQRGHIPLLLATLAEGRADGTFDDERSPFAMLLGVVSLSLFAQVIRRRVPEGTLPLAPPAALADELVAILLDGIRRHKS